MSVHIPESPLKYGFFGLFSFFAVVCIFRLHTGVQGILHTGCARMHTGVQAKGCARKSLTVIRRQAVFFMPSCHDRSSLQVPSRGVRQCMLAFSRCLLPVR